MPKALDPKTLSVFQFMGAEGAPRKVIPRYQRSYAWEPERVEELLKDIDAAISRESSFYFLGAMLCIEHEQDNPDQEKCYHEIVDGQQRLTTLSLIFAFMVHYVNKASPQIKDELGMPPSTFAEKLSSFLYYDGEFLGDLGEGRSDLLKLGDADHMAYHQIINHGPTTSGGKLKQFNDAYGIISEFFESRMKESNSGAKYMRKFAKFLSENVSLVVIFITDEADAYEVFEVLNARNLHLEAVDLIKNKLLSCFGNDEAKVDDAYKKWHDVFIVCGKKAARMQDYVRCHFQMEAGDKVDPKALYRHLRSNLGKVNAKGKEKKAKAYLDSMHNHSNQFEAMFCRDHRFWDEFPDKSINSSVGYLNDYRVVYTIMFSILYAEKPKEFVAGAYHILMTFMKRTRAVLDRLHVIESYEKKLAKLAHEFKEGRGPSTVKEFFEEIKRIDDDELQIVSDSNFIERMSTRPKIKGPNAKSILLELSNYVQNQNKTGTVVDLPDGNIHLEHVFPQNPKNYKEWKEFQNEEVASLYLWQLGNLTLLQGQRNVEVSNKKFADKKQLAYKDSGILLTKELADIPNWTPDEIKKRQKRLAKLAAKVWSFKTN